MSDKFVDRVVMTMLAVVMCAVAIGAVVSVIYLVTLVLRML